MILSKIFFKGLVILFGLITFSQIHAQTCTEDNAFKLGTEAIEKFHKANTPPGLTFSSGKSKIISGLENNFNCEYYVTTSFIQPGTKKLTYEVYVCHDLSSVNNCKLHAPVERIVAPIRE